MTYWEPKVISFGILPLDILGHLIFPLLSFADTLRFGATSKKINTQTWYAQRRLDNISFVGFVALAPKLTNLEHYSSPPTEASREPSARYLPMSCKEAQFPSVRTRFLPEALTIALQASEERPLLPRLVSLNLGATTDSHGILAVLNKSSKEKRRRVDNFKYFFRRIPSLERVSCSLLMASLLPALPSLLHLNISSINSRADASLSELSGCTSLISLTCTAPTAWDGSIIHPQQRISVSNMPHLKSVDMSLVKVHYKSRGSETYIRAIAEFLEWRNGSIANIAFHDVDWIDAPVEIADKMKIYTAVAQEYSMDTQRALLMAQMMCGNLRSLVISHLDLDSIVQFEAFDTSMLLLTPDSYMASCAFSCVACRDPHGAAKYAAVLDEVSVLHALKSPQFDTLVIHDLLQDYLNVPIATRLHKMGVPLPKTATCLTKLLDILALPFVAKNYPEDTKYLVNVALSMIKSDFPHAHITALRKLIISRDLDWLGTSNTLNPSVSELYSTALTFANSGNSAAYLQSLSQKFLRYNKVVYRGLVLMCFQKNSLKILRHFPGFPVSEIGGDAHGNTPMHWIVHHMSNSQYVEDTELLSWFDEFARFDSCVLAKNNAGHTPLDVAFLSSSGCYIQVVLPHFEKLRPAIATEVLKSAISYDAGVLESLVSEKQPTKPIFRHHSTTIGRERIRINPNIAMNGMTPLEFALKNSFCDSAIVLLQSGADSNALSSDYKSPLQLLCEYHALSPYFTNVLSVLRSSGAKMRRPVQDGCSTCLTVFVEKVKELTQRHTSIELPVLARNINSLVTAHGLSFGSFDGLVSSPIHIACTIEDEKVGLCLLQFLVSEHADSQLHDADGNTAVNVSVHQSYIDLLNSPRRATDLLKPKKQRSNRAK